MSEYSINILVAEDNDVSRNMMVTILQTHGYKTFEAGDGGEAIDIIRSEAIDLAIIDVNMAPRGGFDVLRYLVANGIHVTCIVITSSASSDILMKATELGVRRVLQKPVDPDRLVQTIKRSLKQKGLSTENIGITTHDNKLTPEELMAKAIELADQNVKSQKGGPFGAVVADKDGVILGEGVNGVSSQADPIAHAEVMAIRKAADKLGRTNLEDCILYCTSLPTMMGRALIVSVGIPVVFYALSQDDISALREDDKKIKEALSSQEATEAQYEQLYKDKALEMFENWKKQRNKISD